MSSSRFSRPFAEGRFGARRHSDPLHVERLEARMTPALFVVDSTNDEIDLDLSDPTINTASGGVTLRAAIMQAVALGGDHEIELIGGDYANLLNSGVVDQNYGDFDIFNAGGPLLNLTIRGREGEEVWIGRGGLTGDRIFHISGGVHVTIENVTISHGWSFDDDGGGNILVQSSSLTLINTAVLDGSNQNAGAKGGGIAFINYGAQQSLTLINTTIAGNHSDIGAGVYIYNQSSGESITIDHATIVFNYSQGGHTAGVLVEGNSAATLRNSIVAYNASHVGDVDVSGLFNTASTRNVVRFVAAGTTGFDPSLNIVDEALDVGLGTRGYFGGTTLVYELAEGSVAVDYADSSIADDQRGFNRPLGLGSDAGAFEGDFTKTPVSGVVSGRIWYDLDNWGVYDLGEPGIKGVVIELYWSTGDLIATTTTNNKGLYEIELVGELRPVPYAVLYVVATAPTDRYWTYMYRGSDATKDSDFDGAGLSDPFRFHEDQISGHGFSAASVQFPVMRSLPNPVSSIQFDGGILYDIGEGGPVPPPDVNRRSEEDPPPLFTPPPPPGNDPYDFFYRVPFVVTLARSLDESGIALPINALRPSLGQHDSLGEQAYLNLYKVVEIGRRTMTERIAVMTIDTADPNVATGLLGAAAPGRYRITVQDRLGEELVWEGDLPFNFETAQSGLQKAWKTVRSRVDSLRDQREGGADSAAPKAEEQSRPDDAASPNASPAPRSSDAPRSTDAPRSSDAPQASTSGFGWQEEIEQLAVLIKQFDSVSFHELIATELGLNWARS